MTDTSKYNCEGYPWIEGEERWLEDLDSTGCIVGNTGGRWKHSDSSATYEKLIADLPPHLRSEARAGRVLLRPPSDPPQRKEEV